MIGGVFELTSHGLRRYEDRPEVDPVGPQPQDAAWDGKVMIRGGDNGIWGQDWPTLPHYARSAYRVRWAADRPFMSIGFRLLMEDDAPTAVREGSKLGRGEKDGARLSGSTKPAFADIEATVIRGVWIAALAGKRSEQFRRVTLTTEGISNQTIAVPSQYWRLFPRSPRTNPFKRCSAGWYGQAGTTTMAPTG